MAYFSPNIDADGIHVPTYADVMDYLMEQYRAIFGADIYLGEETKDYQLLSVFSKCISDFGELCVDSYNSRNPNYAAGNSLDMLLPLVSMTRRAATCSTAVLTLTGTEGTVVPAKSKVMDASGYLWETDAAAVIGSSGTEVSATCTFPGRISAPAETISSIYDIIDGWNGVVNESDAVEGKDAETDEEVRVRRKQMVGILNNGTYDALIRKLLDVSGVEFADVIANDSGSTDSETGVPAHSICCLVRGGDEADVAEAIWKAKAPGIGTSHASVTGGNAKTVTYTDDYGHANTVKFVRPEEVEVSVAVTIKALAGYDSTRCEELIRGAIRLSINDMGVGKSWSVTMAYRDIYNTFIGEVCPFIINSVVGDTDDQAPSSSEVLCAFNQILTVKDEDITITVV